jgi:methionyl-tRNA synthetase
MTDKPFFITTAISYPNGRPHIGHAYEAIATDALARFHRLSGRDVRFLTGTDEHGLKMMQTARDASVTPQAMADRNSDAFKAMCETFNVSHDRFIRTTDEDHKQLVTQLWRRMAANGDIYLGRYEGWYSLRDEAFYDESELVETSDGKRSPQGTPVEWTVEESYFFRLSTYKEALITHISSHEFILPPHRKNEILRFLSGELRDLSVSRASFDWGITVPDCSDLGVEHRPGHVIYVWVDALANYLTGICDGDFEARVARWNGSAVMHIIGKDIVRFHTVYWPAFLMSARIDLPERVFGHGFLLNRGEKMSKSVGNVVDPQEMAQRFGVDAVRWYMLRKVSFGEDGGFSDEDIILTYNADLANSFGNLVQRVFSFIAKNLDGRVPRLPEADARMASADSELFAANEMDIGQLDVEFGLFNLGRAADELMKIIFRANQYVDTQAPWTLRKTDPARMEAVLAVLCVVIAQIATYLQLFCPASAAKVLAMYGLPPSGGLEPDWYDRWQESGFIIQPPVPIFPRLELPAADA